MRWATTATTSSRVSASPMRRAGTSGWLARLTGGPENASIRGGYGMYHGRIFQSVFSQGGANVRFNPPNAAFLEHHQHVHAARSRRSDRRVRVPARTGVTDRAPDDHGDRSGAGDAVHASMERDRGAADALQLVAAAHLLRHARHRLSEVCAGQPADLAARSPVHRAQSSAERACRRLPRSARRDDRSRGRRCELRGHGIAGHRGDRGVSERGADREQRGESPRAARQRAAARSALYDQSEDQQRRGPVVQRAAGRMDQASQRGAAVPGGVYVGQGDGFAVRSHVRSGRRHESDRARSAVLARASRCSTRVTGSRSTAAIVCRSSRIAAMSWDSSWAAGRHRRCSSSCRARHSR